MKNFILLSLALIASLFALTNVTKAQTATPTLDLEIMAVTGECRHGINLNLGKHNMSYSSFTMTGAFTGNDPTFPRRWSCNDTAGKAPRSVQISSTDLTTGAYTISSGLIEVMTTSGVKFAGGGSFIGSGGAFLARGTNLASPKKLFEKTSAAGTVGQYGVNTVDLRVLVPANQEIGAYRATITIAFPQM